MEEKTITLLFLNHLRLEVRESVILNAPEHSMVRKILADEEWMQTTSGEYVVREYADMMVMVLEAAQTGGRVYHPNPYISREDLERQLRYWGVYSSK